MLFIPGGDEVCKVGYREPAFSIPWKKLYTYRAEVPRSPKRKRRQRLGSFRQPSPERLAACEASQRSRWVTTPDTNKQ